MAFHLLPWLRWRPAVAVLAISVALSGAPARSGSDKPIGNYNIPLWEEGKVPFATGNGPLDNPFVTV